MRAFNTSTTNMFDFFPAFIGDQSPVISFDTGIILFIFIAGLLYGLRAGKKRLMLFILAFYGSVAIVSLIPFIDVIIRQFSTIEEGFVSLGLLGFFTIIVYYVLAGSMVKLYLPIPKYKREQFWQVMVLSFSISGFFVSVVLSTQLDIFEGTISQFTHTFFLSDSARLVWLFAPLVAIRLVAYYRK